MVTPYALKVTVVGGCVVIVERSLFFGEPSRDAAIVVEQHCASSSPLVTFTLICASVTDSIINCAIQF